MTTRASSTAQRTGTAQRSATARHGGTARSNGAQPRGTAHAGLSAEMVIDAALQLVESEGSGALSMRRLAADLGVATTTIYWHVGNRDELVVALIRRHAQRMGESVVNGDHPRDRVLSAARNIWTSALSHRNVTALANQVGATTLLHLPLEVTLLAELQAAGLEDGEAADALRAILFCTAGFLVAAWRDEERVPVELQRRALWASVRDPRVSDGALDALAGEPDTQSLFETALVAIVDAALAGCSRSGRGDGGVDPGGDGPDR